ncbi:MAG: hydrogenase maturation protease [Planctomycetota bacterium]|jgi:hydrogenase maturation protease
MSFSSTHPNVAIVGLGNLLLSDDGVGIHAVRQLQKDPPEGVAVAEVGTAALRAQELLGQADIVIAIDAVEAHGRPGSVYRFDAKDALRPRQASLHDLGIIGVLRLLPERSRPEVTILGVEPQIVDYGIELSPAVHAALPQVIEVACKIAEEVKQRGHQPPAHSEE